MGKGGPNYRGIMALGCDSIVVALSILIFNLPVLGFLVRVALCQLKLESLPSLNMIIKKDKLPANAKEGDILIVEGDNIKIDPGETGKRKKNIEKLMDDLWK